jgi:hypothetical protein
MSSNAPMSDHPRSITRLRPPTHRPVLTRIETEDGVVALRQFRQGVYQARSDVVVDDGVDVDGRGFLFGLLRDEELVGCGRILPLPDPGCGTNAFDQPQAAEHGMDTEVGRLAVVRRGSAHLLLAIVGLGSQWMTENTDLRTFVAYCHQRLVPLYERVGARDLGIDVEHRVNGRPYRLIVGRFDVVAQRSLSMLGLNRPSDHSGYLLPTAAGGVR